MRSIQKRKAAESPPSVEEVQPVAESEKLPATLHERVRAVVSTAIKKHALLPVDRPKDVDGRPLEPRIPNNLVMLKDQQVGQLHADFCAMLQYTHRKLAAATADVWLWRKEVKITRAKAHVLIGRGTSGDKSAEVESNPKVMELEEALVAAEMQERLLQGVLDGYLSGKEATSREMTRRSILEERRGIR